MTLPIPLSVQLSNSRTTKHIERELRSLSFRSVAPGGFASAQFSLDRQLHLSPDELAYYTDVDIYDARNGECVWCGRLEDPGRGVGADGQIWDLAAVGPSAHTRDRVIPLIYVDTSTDKWDRASYSDRGAEVSIRERDADGDNNPAVMVVAPEGTTNFTGWTGEARYRGIRDVGMKLARVRVNVVNGTTTSNLENRLTTAVGAGSRTNAVTPTFSTSETTLLGVINGGNNIPNGNDVVWVRIVRTGASAPATPSVWGEFYDISVRSVLKDINGNDITTSGSYVVNHVLAHEVVADLIGRVLNKYDPDRSSIDTTTLAIYQLAYPDGATPAEILDDLIALEPAYYWAAWETGSTGLHRFEWRQWPSTVRYEADVVDGFSSPGSAEGLYDRVSVRWVDQRGRPRVTTRTQTVPQLAAAGIVRQDRIDLGDATGNQLNANQVGDQFLAEHVTPPNAGTLTVARPIYDHDRGTSVMPWEIRPGHLIRIRGVQPNPNSLNVTTRDGVTVFKIVGVDYDTASASATLELDSHSVTVARELATLQKSLRLRRRR
jgi:hypothetical protein